MSTQVHSPAPRRSQMQPSLMTLLGCLAALLVGLGAETPQIHAQDAQNWALKLFKETKHDFGVVARGADVRHRIEITNPYKETIRISNVGTTCGCTAAEPNQRELTTGEDAYIEVVMDTNKFMRRKDSNVDVTVTFNGTNFKTVRIPITAYIRSDVVMTPGGANFGTVDQGAGSEKTIRISYAGRPNWQISSVDTKNPHVTAEVIETARTGAGTSTGQVNYNLVVKLDPGTPLGTIRDQIVLHTDDTSNPRVPVLVEAKVEPDIIISPAPLPLGEMTPGVMKTVTVVLRGRKPFAIKSIECDSERECFKVRMPLTTQTVHVLPMTVTPPDEPGDFKETFTVEIEGRKEPLAFSAVGTITAKSASR